MFSAESPVNPKFALSSVGGYYIVLAFARDATDLDTVLAAVAPHREMLDDAKAMAFVVLRNRADYAGRQNERGLRWFLDEDGSITESYAAQEGRWALLDPTLRMMSFAPLGEGDRLLRALSGLPPPEIHAGSETPAPVLVVPRILEPEFCKSLIDSYHATGGTPSGVMREVDGKTVGVFDSFKRRFDAHIEDPALQKGLHARIAHRLLPEIRKAFQFEVTRIERYIVACYDADGGGYFRAHRDNTTLGTAHRKFAVSINLNGDFDGGDLRFPEYGRRTYRPPAGGAVVFSCSLLHEATPVTRGVRYATLPFLYDEAGQKVRDANAHVLEPDAEQPAA